jgi:hypothetical protein
MTTTLTNEQTSKCLAIMVDAIELLDYARPDLSVDSKIEFFARYFRHPGAGDFAEELGGMADEILSDH